MQIFILIYIYINISNDIHSSNTKFLRGPPRQESSVFIFCTKTNFYGKNIIFQWCLNFAYLIRSEGGTA
jgi:hypothetical protein